MALRDGTYALGSVLALNRLYRSFRWITGVRGGVRGCSTNVPRTGEGCKSRYSRFSARTKRNRGSKRTDGGRRGVLHRSVLVFRASRVCARVRGARGSGGTERAPTRTGAHTPLVPSVGWWSVSPAVVFVGEVAGQRGGRRGTVRLARGASARP